MKITKDAIKESARLTEAVRAAEGIDNSQKIKEFDEKILEKDFEERKFRTLEYDQEAMKLKNEKDSLKSIKRNLISDRLRAIERTTEAWDKFHRPYKEEFTAKLKNRYGKIERKKKYTVISSTDSNLLLKSHKVRTNVSDVLTALKED